MRRQKPRHAQRIGKIGEQVHDSAGREPEQQRQGGMLFHTQVRSNEDRNPCDAPVSPSPMRNPGVASAAALPPGYFHPVRSRSTRKGHQER